MFQASYLSSFAGGQIEFEQLGFAALLHYIRALGLLYSIQELLWRSFFRVLRLEPKIQRKFPVVKTTNAKLLENIGVGGNRDQ